MTTTTLVIIALVVVAAAVAGWYFVQRRRSERLKGRFGPEYDAALQAHRDRAKAEAELESRAKRVAQFNRRDLSESERARFADQWHRVQARFVDDPAGSIQEADRLVSEVMQAEGYPMTDFEQRAADISVDHPRVVNNYRQAHEIALRHGAGKATTEDLRHALICYRELFDDLLEVHHVEEVRR